MFVYHSATFIIYDFYSVDHTIFLVLVNVKISDSSAGVDLKCLLLILRDTTLKLSCSFSSE